MSSIASLRPTVADMEHAILLVFASANGMSCGSHNCGSERKKAQEYLDQIKSVNGFWRWCAEAYHETNVLELKFWCLQSIVEVRRKMVL